MSKLTRLTPMLQAADIQRTIDFYTKVLDFKLVSCWPETKPSWCCLQRDAIEIMFSRDTEHCKDAPKMTGVLYINTNDVLALHERLKARVKVLWGPEIYHYGMHEFAIEDCNGYTLSFGQQTDEPPTCPE